MARDNDEADSGQTFTSTGRPERAGRRLGRNTAEEPPPPVEEREGRSSRRWAR
jgi:hypothetical protein